MTGVAVSALVVSWNTLDLTRECLASLERQTMPVAQVVVVDNGSTDGSREWLEARENIRLLKADRNLGFAAGNNAGLRLCTGDLVLLVNTDVVLARDYVELCARRFEQPSTGSVTGKLLRPDGTTIDSTGHEVYGLGWAQNRGEMLPDRGFDGADEVFGVSAAAAMYRREALESVRIDGEVLDESYFSYIEDVDLDWRLRWLGWRAWFEPAAVAVHHRSATGARQTAAITRHILKNRLLTVVKNYDAGSLARNFPGIVAFTLVKTVDFGRDHPTATLGLWDAARLLPRALRWRAEIRHRRRVPAVEVSRWLRPFPWRGRVKRRLGGEP